MDELAEQALHVALATWKQTLQEGYVAAVGRQQKSDVRQALDYGQGEGVLGGERVVSGIETQDGYRCVGEFFAWAGVAVVVRTRFITKQQRGEAFVKLPDITRLQHIINIHYFLQNLPMPADGTTQSACEVFVEEQPVERFLHGDGGLQRIPGDGDGKTCHHP